MALQGTPHDVRSVSHVFHGPDHTNTNTHARTNNTRSNRIVVVCGRWLDLDNCEIDWIARTTGIGLNSIAD